jgi:hypothetical protein
MGHPYPGPQKNPDLRKGSPNRTHRGWSERYIDLYMSVCMYLCICICIYVYICLCIYICICIYIYVCIYIYIYIVDVRRVIRVHIHMYRLLYMCILIYIYPLRVCTWIFQLCTCIYNINIYKQARKSLLNWLYPDAHDAILRIFIDRYRLEMDTSLYVFILIALYMKIGA